MKTYEGHFPRFKHLHMGLCAENRREIARNLILLDFLYFSKFDLRKLRGVPRPDPTPVEVGVGLAQGHLRPLQLVLSR